MKWRKGIMLATIIIAIKAKNIESVCKAYGTLQISQKLECLIQSTVPSLGLRTAMSLCLEIIAVSLNMAIVCLQFLSTNCISHWWLPSSVLETTDAVEQLKLKAGREECTADCWNQCQKWDKGTINQRNTHFKILRTLHHDYGESFKVFDCPYNHPRQPGLSWITPTLSSTICSIASSICDQRGAAPPPPISSMSCCLVFPNSPR